jgi:class 3 adenylate cyclase
MTRQVQSMAVLFADVSDSTGLYHKLGDARARNIITACLGEITGLLPRFDGRAIKTIGDELLCVFPSADLAVLAASEMQSHITACRPGDYPVLIHIGLHHGSVLIEDGDIFGDAVNAAAYLTAVAMPEQILTTEATEQCLSAALKSCVRPVFRVILKGSLQESTAYQVLWRTDTVDQTDVNLNTPPLMPADLGSLVLTLEDKRARVDQWRTAITIGRGLDCDLVVTDRCASRRHLTVKLMRTNFYVIDHSINGTYVSLESGEEVHVLRGELLLEGAGHLTLGRRRAERPPEIIRFARDRRSMYRI